jgi:peptidoglycan/LPS O-acetylase OafA/YrhL
MSRFNAKKSASIDCARGIAALAVVLFHAFIWIGAPEAPGFFDHGFFAWWQVQDIALKTFSILDFGFLGVNLFFVISGYCIHIANIGQPNICTTDFFIRRFFRIYPLYLFITLALFFIFGEVTNQSAEKGINPSNFIGHLFFWHYLGPDASSGMGISVVMWTLALEVQFYALYIITYPTILRFGIIKVATAFLCFELVYRVLFHLLQQELESIPQVFLPNRFSVARYGEWLVGAVMAEKIVNSSIAPRTKTRKMALSWLAAGTALLISSVYVGKFLNWNKYTSTDLSSAIAFGMIIYGTLSIERSTPFNNFSIINWLSSRCYSIYLTHATAILFLSKASKMKPGIFDSRGALFFAGVVLSFGLSEIAFRLIERPSHQLARRVAKKFARAV